MRGAYRSGGIRPALASTASARNSAGPRSGSSPVMPSPVMTVTAQLPQARPRTSHLSHSMAILSPCGLPDNGLLCLTAHTVRVGTDIRVIRNGPGVHDGAAAAEMSVPGITVVSVTDTLGSFARPGTADVRLCDLDFTVVDVETTGWSPDVAGITEVGAVLLRRGEVVAEFTSLVNPGTPVPASITELTGITDQMLALAPPAAAVLPGLLAFAQGSVLAAHNAPFDLGFLTSACAAAGLGWPGFEVLDTVRLARHLMVTPDEVPDCKLRTLADYFGTPVQPSHRALADAKATASVLAQLLLRLADRQVHTIGELTAWLADRDAEAAAAAAASGQGWARRLARAARALPGRARRMLSRGRGDKVAALPNREAASGHRHRLDQGRDRAHP